MRLAAYFYDLHDHGRDGAAGGLVGVDLVLFDSSEEVVAGALVNHISVVAELLHYIAPEISVEVVDEDPESGLRLHCGVEHGADLWGLVFFHNCYLLFK